MQTALFALAAAALSGPNDLRGTSIGRELTALNQCVGALAKEDRYSGVVAIARNGTLIDSFAFGHPDSAASEPMTLATRFNIASAGKMFTAVAIGQLVEAGRLRFDEPIGDILPDLPQEVRQITVDQLLTHRSGLGDYLRFENREAIRAARTATDLLPLAVGGGVSFPPGSKQQYSNSGFVVLGAIIEKLSGEPYSDYVRTHIFIPAGMTTADLDRTVGRAVALTKRNPDGTQSTSVHAAPVMGGSRGSPAGGATASALDMIRFGEALRAGKLLSRPIIEQLWIGRVPGPAQAEGKLSYGYGFARIDFDGGRWLVGHNGGSLGVNAEFELFPVEGYTAVALSNYDPPSATDVIAMARRALLGQPPCVAK